MLFSIRFERTVCSSIPSNSSPLLGTSCSQVSSKSNKSRSTERLLSSSARNERFLFLTKCHISTTCVAYRALMMCFRIPADEESVNRSSAFRCKSLAARSRVSSDGIFVRGLQIDRVCQYYVHQQPDPMHFLQYIRGTAVICVFWLGNGS
jgi:hypothetical protein